MINIIYGAKGTGKTKKIIVRANESLEKTRGEVLFLASSSRYRMEIKSQIRFVDISEVGINNKDGLIGFLKGLLSANYDIEKIYIDGMSKMMGISLNSPEMAEFMLQVEGMAKNVDFILTVSCLDEELPEFIAKFKE